MITLLKTVQVIVSVLLLLFSVCLSIVTDIGTMLGLILLLNASVSIAIIFNENATYRDKTISTFITYFIGVAIQLYTVITAIGIIFSHGDFIDWLFKLGVFICNIIVIGVVFHAYKNNVEKEN